VTTVSEDVAFPLARNVAATKYENLPTEAVETTKRCILDTVGVILAASGISPVCRTVIDIVREGGGKEESSIFGYGAKVPAWMAAYANGSMAQSLDYDDVYDEGRNHCSGSTIPAAFAMAERVGKVSGKDFITTVAAGIDLTARMGLAVCESKQGYEDDWFLSPLFGAYSATAAAGKLLGLNDDHMVNALGIVFNQAAGSMEMSFQPGAQIRELYSAFPGITGVLSALWAHRGITGVKNCMESRAGLYNMYFKGHYDRNILLDGLGKDFLVTRMGFKAWPSCRLSHSHINAAWDIVTEQDIKPEEVEEVIVYVCDSNKTLMEPLEERQRPQMPTAAKRSIPFTVATMITKRNLVIADFTPEALKDQFILDLAKKVKPEYDQSLFSTGIPPAVVDIKTRSGKTFSKRIENPYGHPKNPLSTEKLIEKFKDCVSYSVKPLDSSTVEKIIELITGLERVDDMNKVIRLFV
jgi:2-methylcitrate dehydratase PrpD